MTQQEFNALYESLSINSRTAFVLIATNTDYEHINQYTIDELVRAGLIQWYERKLASFYSVPIAIHILWCDWCSRNVEDDS